MWRTRVTSDKVSKECGRLRYWGVMGRAFKAEGTAFTKSWGAMKIQVCVGNCSKLVHWT